MLDGFSAKELAELLGLSERHLRRLDDAGVITKAGRGRYARSSVRTYCDYLRKQDGAGELDERQESARLKQSQRLLNEMKLKQLDGSLVDLESVNALWVRCGRAIMTAMRAAPGDCRFRLPHLSAHDADVIHAVIQDRLKDADFSAEFREQPPFETAIIGDA